MMTMNLSTLTINPEENVLQRLGKLYEPFHVPIVIILASFGIFCHALLLKIFSRKQMISPTNIMLMSLSCSQLTLLLTYMLVVVFKQASPCDLPWLSSFSGTTFFLYLVNANLVFHTLGVFHVLAISIVRCITICIIARRTQSNPIFTYSRSLILLAFLYTIVPAFCIPFYLNSKVEQIPDGLNCYDPNMTHYSVQWTSVELRNLNFWIFGIFAKLIPCTLLIVLSCVLSTKMQQLEAKSSVVRTSCRVDKKRNAVAILQAKPVRKYSQTTALILLVMILFVVVELPQGVLNLLAGLKDDSFRVTVLNPLNDMLETLTVFYSSVNFILFCLMSSQMRSILNGWLKIHLCCPKPRVDKALTIFNNNNNNDIESEKNAAVSLSSQRQRNFGERDSLLIYREQKEIICEDRNGNKHIDIRSVQI